ncbi:MAG: threonine synthase, partial [Clostridia bacterium]|nr:threonine synthase [Clostridia bacterium]
MAADTIKKVFADKGYLADPHTAVAINVYEAYKARTGDDTPTVIASTASPFKFPLSVLKALDADCSGEEFDLLDRVSEISGLNPPAALANLKDAKERFTGSIPPANMRDFLSEGFIG